MWRTNAKIGFDDRLVILVAIPLFALLIPFVFFGIRFDHPPYFTWASFFSSLFMTATVWLGNRLIMIQSRKHYPKFEEVRKRLWMQSLSMLAFTLLATNLLGLFLNKFCSIKKDMSLPDIIISSNAATLFCTLTVVSIYESIYFINELRASVEEKELLKRENLKAQLNALRTQVNPHFLFNNLNTLSSIIPEDPEQAINFVQQLSKVYRHVLEVRDEQSILLEQELEVMEAYAFLLQTRFGDNLTIHLNVPPEKLQQKIVPLSLQILMENAIKHNIVSSEKPLTIRVFTDNGRLVVSNTLQKKNQLTESTGIGLENIRNRHKLVGSRQVEVSENETSFTVSIPLIEN